MSGSGRVLVKRSLAVRETLTGKRQKIALAATNGTDSNTVIELGNNSPNPTSSKCAPLSPIPVESRGAAVTNPVTKQSNTNLQFIGPYRVVAPLEENSQACTAIDTRDETLVICRRLDRSKYMHMMQLSHRLSSGVNAVNVIDEEANKRTYQQVFAAGSELIVGDDGHYYYLEPKHFGSLHAYVVERKRLSEQESLWFFRQIVGLLVFCHSRGVVLRDLKLRKFVFADPEHRYIRLDGIDELFVCPETKYDESEEQEQDDKITDRHGCPAYVGPEILDINQKFYSGRAADIWSLGVLLYVILYGRYPFYDTTPARLFAKIRLAQIHLMEETGISYEARSLIRCLLRRDPSERPSAFDILAHPWLQSRDKFKYVSKRTCSMAGTVVQTLTGMRVVLTEKETESDQCVPSVDLEALSRKKVKNDKETCRSNVSDGSSVSVPSQ